MCLDTPAGLLNPTRKPLGPFDSNGALLTAPSAAGHFLHRCPKEKT